MKIIPAALEKFKKDKSSLLAKIESMGPFEAKLIWVAWYFDGVIDRLGYDTINKEFVSIVLTMDDGQGGSYRKTINLKDIEL